MKKKKEKKEKKYAKKYKEMEAEGHVGYALAKSGIDLVLGSTLGAGIGAASGRLSLPIGLVLLLSGHYFGEETGVIRTTGTAAIAYGIAKAIANQNLAEQEAVNGFTLAGETSKAKTRLENFKDELFEAYFINKLLKKKKENSSAEAETEGEAVGSIDLSSLDFFEEQLEQSAQEFQESLPESLPERDDLAFDLEIEAPISEEYPEEQSDSFLELDDDPDLSNI